MIEQEQQCVLDTQNSLLQQSREKERNQSMTDGFIHRRAYYKLWAEDTKGRYEDQRNGVIPRRRYDQNNN